MGISATGTTHMKLGYNFMWAENHYGLYFGPHFENPKLRSENRWDTATDSPRKWDVSKMRETRYEVEKELMGLDRWVDVFAARMRYLRNTLKIEVVRVFLLCNAQNYGSLSASGAYQPPDFLHPRFIWHFEHMLVGARDAGIQLIPCLLDFGICNPDWSKNKRWPMINDPKFFPTIFDPLLTISADYRSTIYAWEVMNEPAWMLSSYYPFRATIRDPITWLPTWAKVSEEDLKKFLQRGVAKIKEYEFESTVGHRYYVDMFKLPTGTRPQFHYYRNEYNPWNKDLDVIADARAKTTLSEKALPFVGEFGCGAEHGVSWPELEDAGLNERNTPDRVFERLRLLKRKNYELAMLWTDGPDPTDWPDLNRPPKIPDPLKLTTDCELGIFRYLDYFNLR